MDAAARRGASGLRTWLKRAMDEAPPYVYWDIRVNPQVWLYNPKLKISSTLSEIPTEQVLPATLSFIGSDRLMLAKQLLTRDPVLKGFSNLKGMELMGDIEFLMGNHSSAGVWYLRALRHHNLDSIDSEALIVKAAVTLYRYKDAKALQNLFTIHGAIAVDASSQHIDLVHLLSQSNGNRTPGLVFLKRWSRADGIVLTLLGLLRRNPVLIENGILIWEAGDPLFGPLGTMSISLALKYSTVMDRMIEGLGVFGHKSSSSKEASSFITIEAFLNHLAYIYVTGSKPFVVQEQPSQYKTLRVTRYSFGVMYQAIHRALRFPTARTYIIRDRTGTVIGMEGNGIDEVLDPDRRGLSLAEWKKVIRPTIEGAKKGTYLLNLGTKSFQAENLFRKGLYQAHSLYDLNRGVLLISQALSQDPSNIHAAASLAQLFALMGRWEDCMEQVEYVTSLDPLYPDIKSLLAITAK